MVMLVPGRELQERIRELQLAIDCATTINHAADKLDTDDRITIAGAALIVNNVINTEIKRLLKEGLNATNR
jgi:hypothetical protein